MVAEQFKGLLKDLPTMTYLKILSVVQIDDPQAFIHE
jgi:hypothetical protein